jgi:hypothetical protein
LKSGAGAVGGGVPDPVGGGPDEPPPHPPLIMKSAPHKTRCRLLVRTAGSSTNSMFVTRLSAYSSEILDVFIYDNDNAATKASRLYLVAYILKLDQNQWCQSTIPNYRPLSRNRIGRPPGASQGQCLGHVDIQRSEGRRFKYIESNRPSS